MPNKMLFFLGMGSSKNIQFNYLKEKKKTSGLFSYFKS